MMRRLTSAPKPSARVSLVHREQVARVARCGGRSARRRSGRGWRSPRPGRSRSRRRSRGGRAAGRSPAPLPPSSSIRSSARAHDLGHARLEALLLEAPGRRSGGRRGARRSGSATSSGRPSEVESQGSRPSRARSISAASVTSRVSGPALVERRGEGDHPVAGDRAVGGLQADDPAQRGRLADRAAGVGADRPRRDAGRHGRGAAAARAARHALAVPGVLDRAEAGVLVRRAHRELVLVGLAEHRRAGRLAGSRTLVAV